MSGLVKGVKKVFKAIGNAVKKVLKSPIFKAILIAAAVIFTGGAAIGAFGALAGGASFGAAMSAGLAAGIAPFSAAMSALSGAASSLTGGGAMATAAAEAAAPGALAWATPAAETASLFAGEAAAGTVAETLASGTAETLASGAGETLASGAGETLANSAGEVLANGAAPDAMTQAMTQAGADGAAAWNTAQPAYGSSLADMAGQAAQGTMQPMNAGINGMEMANAMPAPTTAMQPVSAMPTTSMPKPGNFMSSLWDFVKPETAAGKMMWGQTISGIGNSLMQGRAGQAQRDYDASMRKVPDMTGSFELKPGYRWTPAGGQ